MIPTALGNMLGGGLFVGTIYWYLYLTGEVGVQIDFNSGGIASAMEIGGPMRNVKASHRKESDGTLIGQDPYATSNGSQGAPQQQNQEVDQLHQLPSPNGVMMSSFGKELSDSSPYAKTHAERTRSEQDEEKA